MVLHLISIDQTERSESGEQRHGESGDDGVRHSDGPRGGDAFDAGMAGESLSPLSPPTLAICHTAATSERGRNIDVSPVARETIVATRVKVADGCGFPPREISVPDISTNSSAPINATAGSIITHEIACDACCGTGRSHFGACSWCERGWRMVRIDVHPDCTGIAPNWARWSAYDADRYDGAPDSTGAGSAVGCGQTPAEAVADLIERLESEL